MLSSKDMERQLQLIPLQYFDFFFAPVEYGKGVWQGIKAYKDMRDRQPHLIPTQKEFIREFLKRTIKLFPPEQLMTQYENYKLGLMARANRAYRSLVREEHCIQRMNELYPQEGISVVYDFENDWKNGVDVTLIDHETRKVHYVHLFVDSPKAKQFRKHKEKRGQGRDFSKHVDFPFRKEEGKKVGDFYLYSDEQILTFAKRLRTDYKHKGEEWTWKEFLFAKYKGGEWNGKGLPISS